MIRAPRQRRGAPGDRLSVVIWLLGSAVLLSCAKEDESAPAPAGFCAGRDCSCPAEPLAACDITASGCQKKVAARVACVRGAELELPEVETITREEYRARVSSMPEATEMPAMDAMQENTDLAIETTLKQLGLLDPDQSADQSAADFTVSFIAAYYSSETKHITVVEEEDEPRPLRGSMGIFAHELVHAAQDQEGLFEAVWQSHQQVWDGLSAGRMVVEGEATLYGLLTEAAMLGESAEAAGIDQYLDFDLKRAQQEMATADSPLWAALTYPAYAVGGRVLYEAWHDDGPRAVEEIVSTSTPSAIGWMRGDPTASFETEVLTMPEPPPDFVDVFSARLGANVVFAFLASAPTSGDLSLAPNWELARSWVADTLTVYTTENRTAFAWRARFRDREASDAFRGRVRTLQNVSAVTCSETDSVLLWTDIDTDTRGWRSIVTGGTDLCGFPLSVELATAND